MMPTPTWMPHEEWDALVRGDTCPVCPEMKSSQPENDEGFTITDLAISRLRLARNQYVRGYCVLLCHQHVREPYDLDEQDQRLFFDDLMRVGRALDGVFNPLKMNFNILGNAVPHLHVHILPRYHGDPAPHRPIDPGAGRVELSVEEYQERIEAIRGALGDSRPASARRLHL
jgi:diadenosine tetraphosphate (Ap4A) HIT family hydrolase